MSIDLNILLEQIDLAALVEGYGVDLVDQGGDYVALCPLHPDKKSRSFRIYSRTQSYFCFGCKAGGNAIDFVMRVENIPFRDALNKLAIRVGYDESGFGFREITPKTTKKNIAAVREQVEAAATKALRDIYFSLKKDDSLPVPKGILDKIDTVWKWYDQQQVDITTKIMQEGYDSPNVENAIYTFYAEFLRKLKELEIQR